MSPESTAPSGQALPAGTRLEEFEVERVLGTGGFGITYLSRDTSLGRKVVIKENLPSAFAFRDTASGTVRSRSDLTEDEDNFRWSMENFLREADTLASLDHPGIVPVLRKFEANGTAYFVMPFEKGLPLDELMKNRRERGEEISDDELRGLLEHVLDALGHLHNRGIYHRDIKPGNILITKEGVPILIDFGSARQRLSERSMTVIESAGYTPFEQLQSRGNVGPWSDLYSLGATVAKAITGEAPPKAMDRMRDDPYELLSQDLDLGDRFSSVLLGSIDRALEVNEQDRWQDAEEWQQALKMEENPLADSRISFGNEAYHGKRGQRNVDGPGFEGQGGLESGQYQVDTLSPLPPVRRSGKFLLMQEGCQLPNSHCICCAKPAAKRYKKWFAHTPGAIWIAVISPIILLILWLCLRKKRKLQFGLCEEHAKTTSKKNAVCYTCGGLFIPVWWIGGMLESAFFGFVGLVMFVLWIVFLHMRRPIKMVGLQNGYMKVAGVSSSFLKLLKL